MKRFRQIGGLLATLLLIHGVAFAEDDVAPQADLSWDQTALEVSVVGPGTLAEAWFTFSNQSKSVIKVLDVDSACDCLVAQMDRHTYYPGEDGVLLATLQLKEGQMESSKDIVVTTTVPGGTSLKTTLRVTARRKKE